MLALPNARSHALFLAFWLLSVAVLWSPLRALVALSLADNEYSHLVLIPILAAGLTFWDRRAIFRAAAPDLKLGIPLAAAALAAGWALAARSGLTLFAVAALCAWTAGFLLCYGLPSLRSARFPLLILLLMVPVPPALMARLVAALQAGSAEVAYRLFRLCGVPLFREGVHIELPRIGVEIARECSSIHSGVALFITALLVGHFLLRSLPAKLLLSLSTLPIAVFTNGVRVVTLWFLATRVDVGFMTGDLHKRGGALFSMLSLAVLLLFVYGLRALERRTHRIGVATCPIAPVPSS